MQHFSSWLSSPIYKIYPKRKESCLCRAIACMRSAAMNWITRHPPAMGLSYTWSRDPFAHPCMFAGRGPEPLLMAEQLPILARPYLLHPALLRGFPVNKIFWKHQSLGGKEYAVCVYITYYYIIYCCVLYNIHTYVHAYISVFIFIYTRMSLDTFFWNQIFGLFSPQIPQYSQKVDWISTAAHADRAPGTDPPVGSGGPAAHVLLSWEMVVKTAVRRPP